MVEIAQPRSRLVPNVPSLSLRSLNSGLVLRRGSASWVLSSIDILLRSRREAYEWIAALAIIAGQCNLVLVGVGVAGLVVAVGEDHLGPVRRMIATSRPTASSRGALAKWPGWALARLSGMPESR